MLIRGLKRAKFSAALPVSSPQNLRSFSSILAVNHGNLSSSSHAQAKLHSLAHARSISTSSTLIRLFRIPITSITLGAGVVTWVSFKVDQATSSVRGVWGDLSGAVSDGLGYLQSLKPDFGGGSNGNGNGGDGSGNGSGNSNGNSNSNSNRNNTGGKVVPAVAALTTLKAPLTATQEDTADPSLMNLTRKLIHIRSILQSIPNHSSASASALQLPSIVVIGSQSSGKSSVLESVVGETFLPKGDQMVTRRPIELTLIHSPSLDTPYAVFSSSAVAAKEKQTHITDFKLVQSELTRLNLAVPAAECVSTVPIQLSIYSASVPDLTLVDLPGYVALASADQPAQLKEAISSLCDKYIQAPNLILAVCAADVDLANSPALSASRAVDPYGQRTIGVLTKVDLVSPDSAVAVLGKNKYPLALGWVGVSKDITYFDRNSEIFSTASSPMSGALIKPRAPTQTLSVGHEALRHRLTSVLEKSMSSSLHGITAAVELELQETNYEFKVQYNDRPISPETYVAETIDSLKARFHNARKDFFGKNTVQDKIKDMLDQKALDILESLYWMDSKLKDICQPDESNHWDFKLQVASGMLTKSGVGRDSTNLVASALSDLIDSIAQNEPFSHHANAAERLAEIGHALLRDRLAVTSDQVENCIKPFKFEVEVEPHEWAAAQAKSISLLKSEYKQAQASLHKIQERVGGSRKLSTLISYISSSDAKEHRQSIRSSQGAKLPSAKSGPGQIENNEPAWRSAHNPAHLIEAQQAMLLSERLATLKLRISAAGSKQCRSSSQNAKLCPEVFLNAVSEKLARNAVLFINIELLEQFFHQFPREIDSRLMYDLDPVAISRFASEHPEISKHIEIQEKRAKLEECMKALQSLISLRPDVKPPQRRFGIF